MDGNYDIDHFLNITSEWGICPITGRDIDECNEKTQSRCSHELPKYYLHECPKVTVDIVIRYLPSNRFILIERKNKPFGWALPGGFVDIGETTMEAAIREAYEEVQVKLSNVKQFHTYSHPTRDKRGHGITIVYTADTIETPVAADDAKATAWYNSDYTFEHDSAFIPRPKLCFDHAQIIMDVIHFNKTGERPTRE